jgi:membrane protease YdiL (CAAX protease family)
MSDLDYTPHEPEPDPTPVSDQMPLQAVQTTAPPAELFQSWSQPEVVPPARIPHLGHLALLAAILLFSFACMSLSIYVAVHFHFGGVTTLDDVKNNVAYILGGEAILYLVTLALCAAIFPLIWNEGFFAGIHWRGSMVIRYYPRLIFLAMGCIALAIIDDRVMPGPPNAPIDNMFRSPGAAWLMFAFGITFAPFFEEIGFRGFLLPSLATAWDWLVEKSTDRPAPPLDANGHPQWSLPAMVAASIATSLPFALLHAEQTGWAPGPIVLLVAVSLILCMVRLRTRSLAASVLVHSCYNFTLFLSALVSSGGFRHFDKP